MITTPWDEIDAATLQALCDAGEAESTTLEFKHIAPRIPRDDPDIRQGVCALANAGGGRMAAGHAPGLVPMKGHLVRNARFGSATPKPIDPVGLKIANNGGICDGNGLDDQKRLAPMDVDAGITARLHASWQCVREVRCGLYDETGTWRPAG